ncbi:hypothetical protein PCE1_003352 [Barthelona sp. PCE]
MNPAEPRAGVNEGVQEGRTAEDFLCIQKDSAFLKNFFLKFVSRSDGSRYIDMLREIFLRQSRLFFLYIDDLVDVNNFGEDFRMPDEVPHTEFLDVANRLESNSVLARKLVGEVVDELLEELPSILNIEVPAHDKDTMDYILDFHNERLQREIQQAREAGRVIDEENMKLPIPVEMMRRYDVCLIPRLFFDTSIDVLSVRRLRSDSIGCLRSVEGVAVRVGPVSPYLRVAVYNCSTCNAEVTEVIGGFTYMPRSKCTMTRQNDPNALCGGALEFKHTNSRFVAFQEVILQELPHTVPSGQTPQLLQILVYGDLVRNVAQGDLVRVAGVFLPSAVNNFVSLKRGPVVDTHFLAQRFYKIKQETLFTRMSEEEKGHLSGLSSLSNDPRLKLLSDSIAPHIFGMDSVKRSLLLQLVGSPEVSRSGSSMRGELNILLVGDPGVAKSQLIKRSVALSPRGVYTTGQSSTGVGLTASVRIDPRSRVATLEGGAMVLADGGLLAIDEFEKLDIENLNSMYEVMESGTLSIAKAGIQCTVNVKAAVLAAANALPRGKTLEQRTGLDTAILSRFDIIWRLRDENDQNKDELLAKHILAVHAGYEASDNRMQPVDSDIESSDSENEEDENEDYSVHSSLSLSPSVLRAFINQARQINPVLSADLIPLIEELYADMREMCRATPRNLMAMIRLSIAHARLRLSEVVEDEDIRQASVLVFKSTLDEDAKTYRANSIDEHIKKAIEEIRGIRTV